MYVDAVKDKIPEELYEIRRNLNAITPKIIETESKLSTVMNAMDEMHANAPQNMSTTILPPAPACINESKLKDVLREVLPTLIDARISAKVNELSTNTKENNDLTGEVLREIFHNVLNEHEQTKEEEKIPMIMDLDGSCIFLPGYDPLANQDWKEVISKKQKNRNKNKKKKEQKKTVAIPVTNQRLPTTKTIPHSSVQSAKNRSVRRNKWVFVSNFDLQTDTHEIVHHIATKCNTKAENVVCESLSRRDANIPPTFLSFKVGLKNGDSSILLNPRIWPSGIRTREYDETKKGGFRPASTRWSPIQQDCSRSTIKTSAVRSHRPRN